MKIDRNIVDEDPRPSKTKKQIGTGFTDGMVMVMVMVMVMFVIAISCLFNRLPSFRFYRVPYINHKDYVEHANRTLTNTTTKKTIDAANVGYGEAQKKD